MRKFDLVEHNASLVMKDFPIEYLSRLHERDGTTIENPFDNNGTYERLPSWMYAFGLVKGVAGSHIRGWDWAEWLTPLGQATLDKLKNGEGAVDGSI